MTQFSSIQVNSAQIEEARELRASRDQQFSNIYVETETDMRYVGDLGEIVFRDLLKYINCDATWITNDVTGQSDFKIGQGPSQISLEIKTVKRKAPPRGDYTAQITARHVEKVTDGYVFMSYCYPTETMYVLGYCQYQFFLKHAQYYGAGEYVHPQYRIRDGHEIYNIGISKLYPAVNFLEDLSSKYPITLTEGN